MSAKISVLMGIYNCAGTLAQAVASIQAQTYTNWELILCDDGSTDGTYEAARALAAQDSRIVLLRNEKNLGLNQTLNRCLAASTGAYIARMDGDDECAPERFETQLAFLEANPAFQIVSSDMILFDETGDWGRASCPAYPRPEDTVGGTAFCHAAVMLKRECMDAVGGYAVDRRTLRVEDVDLWIRLYAAGFRGCNLRQPLYRMRNDQNALNRRKYIYRINSTRVRLRGCRMLHLGIGSRLRALRPMLHGLVPARLRQAIRKRQRGANDEKGKRSEP